MDEESNVNDDTQNVTVDDTQGEVSDIDTNDNSDQDSAEETVEERLARVEAQNRKLFIRAKEAEGFKFVNGEWVKQSKPVIKPQAQPTQPQSEFSYEDIALLVSQVPNKEDRELVKTYAKREGRTLEEMLSDRLVRDRLKERAEQRTTAEVAHTGAGKRTTAKVSEEQIVQKGFDMEDPEALAEARFNQRKKK